MGAMKFVFYGSLLEIIGTVASIESNRFFPEFK